MKTKKEMQILMMERDRLLDALRRLDEGREEGKVTKLDYDILHERYENKLREVEAELGLGEEKPGKLARLKLWRRKHGKRT